MASANCVCFGGARGGGAGAGDAPLLY
ncbi:hypothetical protein AYI68_g6588, partial [Smittium mucronatum]